MEGSNLCIKDLGNGCNVYGTLSFGNYDLTNVKVNGNF